MVIGALLLFSPYFGFRFFMDHAGAFFNVALNSNPAVLSCTNNVVLCTMAAGILGLALLGLSVFSFVRSSHSHHHPGGR